LGILKEAKEEVKEEEELNVKTATADSEVSKQYTKVPPIGCQTGDEKTTYVEIVSEQPLPSFKSPAELLKIYMLLSKAKLASLVVVTTMIGYIMVPIPFQFMTFATVTAGTSLAIASANTFNQIFEVDRDSQVR
jgi:hypothetical protein